jgi:hypothetical protein
MASFKHAMKAFEERRVAILQYLSFCSPSPVSPQEIADALGVSRLLLQESIVSLDVEGFVLVADNVNPARITVSLPRNWPAGRRANSYTYFVRNAPPSNASSVASAAIKKQSLVPPGERFILAMGAEGGCRTAISTAFGGVLTHSDTSEEPLFYPAESYKPAAWKVSQNLSPVLNLRLLSGETYDGFLALAARTTSEHGGALDVMHIPPPPGTLRIVLAVPDSRLTSSVEGAEAYIGTLLRPETGAEGAGVLLSSDAFLLSGGVATKTSTGQTLRYIFLGTAAGGCRLFQALGLWG